MFLDLEPEAVTSHRISGFALDNNKKNCYTAVSDGKNYLFLSSSPSVIY